jgi:hypothetical protein
MRGIPTGKRRKNISSIIGLIDRLMRAREGSGKMISPVGIPPISWMICIDHEPERISEDKITVEKRAFSVGNRLSSLLFLIASRNLLVGPNQAIVKHPK